MVKPADFAQEGESFITNSVIWPEETKEAAENRMRKRYNDFELRFDYEHLVCNFDLVTSEDFGYFCSNLPRGEAIGVAVYGKKKKEL